MGPSPGNWLAARADLTFGKTAICIFVAKFYGRLSFFSPTQTLSAVKDIRLYPIDCCAVDTDVVVLVTPVVQQL